MKILAITTVLLLACYTERIHSQVPIKSGNICGIWTTKSSPYLIKGDINIPAGKTLTIQPGVTVKFDGPWLVNVQGSLIAEGTENDNIVFTVLDTTGITNRSKTGWNGIRFDPRPVRWDTLRFKMPENKDLKKILEAKIKKRELDTSMRIYLALKVPDVISDTISTDNPDKARQSSILSFCRFEYATAEGRSQPYIFGGAVYIYRYSNLLINNCLFRNNSAWAGGAIYCKEAAPVLANNRIINCNAHSSGGAMAFVQSGPVIVNNTIQSNQSGYNGGAVLFHESSPYVLNNTFLKNRAENSGGAIHIEQKEKSFLGHGQYNPALAVRSARDPSLDKSVYIKTPLQNTTSYYGRFINNVIGNNKALMGGGISLFAAMPEFSGLTVADNIADSAGGGVFCSVSAPQFLNSILFGNSQEQVFLTGESRPSFQFCHIESGPGGIGKDTSCKVLPDFSTLDNSRPKFGNPASGDYSLVEGSGCVDSGIPDTSSLKLPPVDLSGKNRIVNNRIDLGALEYTGTQNRVKSTEDSNIGYLTINNTEEEMYTSVFPNPTTGCFSIVIHNNKYATLTIKILTQTGKTGYIDSFIAEKWVEKEIDMTGLAKGIYIIMITSGDVLIYSGEIIID